MDEPIEDIFELIHNSPSIKCNTCNVYIKKCGMKSHRRSKQHKFMEELQLLMAPDPIDLRGLRGGRPLRLI